MTSKKFVTSLLSSILIALAIGCASTVIPKKVSPAVASFDGNDQNSGVIAFTPDGGAYITPHARERYNMLIDKYGTRFTPQLTHDAGISPYFFDPPKGQDWHIDAEHLAKFATMNRWRHENK